MDGVKLVKQSVYKGKSSIRKHLRASVQVSQIFSGAKNEESEKKIMFKSESAHYLQIFEANIRILSKLTGIYIKKFEELCSYLVQKMEDKRRVICPMGLLIIKYVKVVVFLPLIGIKSPAVMEEENVSIFKSFQIIRDV